MDTTPVELPLRPIRRREYEQMAELGMFDYEKVELLFGRIVPKSPIGERHCWATERINEVLILALHGKARLRPALPYPASDISMPEPDYAVFPPGRTEDHPDEPWLVVEISHSSLRLDTTIKSRLYAEAEVPDYWVVDLVHDVVRAYRKPKDARWTEVFERGPGDVLQPLRFSEVDVSVSDLLGLQ